MHTQRLSCRIHSVFLVCKLDLKMQAASEQEPTPMDFAVTKPGTRDFICMSICNGLHSWAFVDHACLVVLLIRMLCSVS